MNSVKLFMSLVFAAALIGCASADNTADKETSVSKQVAITDLLQSDIRSDEDKARDAGRKPAEVLAFLGIEPGMQVLDVIAASGYYTEALAMTVGQDGLVYAQNPDFVLRMREGYNDKALSARLSNNRLANVVRLDTELTDLQLTANSLDAAFTALNLHDVYNRSPEAAVDMLSNIKSLLKPGGIMGVVDHNGDPSQDNAKLHRMTQSQAIEVAEKAGFIVESSDVLANPNDDKSQNVFASRGATDRFVLKLTKP
jgi:predicted methyltransferase